MVNVKDGTTIAFGHIFAIAPVAVYEELPDGSTRKTDRTDGVKVTLACGDGMLVVKVPEELIGSTVQPIGTAVAWVVRSGYFSINGGGMATRYERDVNPGDLDAIHSTVNSKASASK